jgi:hypothetical protein
MKLVSEAKKAVIITHNPSAPALRLYPDSEDVSPAAAGLRRRGCGL